VAPEIVIVGHQRLAVAEAEPECAPRAPCAAGVEPFVEVEGGLLGAVGHSSIARKPDRGLGVEGAQAQHETVIGGLGQRRRTGGRSDGESGATQCDPAHGGGKTHRLVLYGGGGAMVCKRRWSAGEAALRMHAPPKGGSGK